jgi:hypothetical protein
MVPITISFLLTPICSAAIAMVPAPTPAVASSATASLLYAFIALSPLVYRLIRMPSRN